MENIDNIIKSGNVKAKSIENLAKSKKPDYAKVNFSGLDFLMSKAYIALFCFQKAFIKAPIFHYVNLKYYVCIEINVSSFGIDRDLC